MADKDLDQMTDKEKADLYESQRQDMIRREPARTDTDNDGTASR